MSLKDFSTGLTGFLDGITDFAKGTIGSYTEVKDAIDQARGKDDDNKAVTVPPQPQNSTYNPNLTASDFLAMPNMKLFAGGFVLLIIALVLMRK